MVCIIQKNKNILTFWCLPSKPSEPVAVPSTQCSQSIPPKIYLSLNRFSSKQGEIVVPSDQSEQKITQQTFDNQTNPELITQLETLKLNLINNYKYMGIVADFIVKWQVTSVKQHEYLEKYVQFLENKISTYICVYKDAHIVLALIAGCISYFVKAETYVATSWRLPSLFVFFFFFCFF